MRERPTTKPPTPQPPPMGAAAMAEAMQGWPNRWPHRHKWQGVAVERAIPLNVIQSCECGDVRRVEVPE